MKKFARLLNRMLLKIDLDTTRTKLKFHLEDGTIFTYRAEGDCCSQSWIEYFESPDKPAKILAVDTVEIDGDQKPTETAYYEEEMEYVFYRVLTDKGSYDIEMRNSSNGFYGGYLEEV